MIRVKEIQPAQQAPVNLTISCADCPLSPCPKQWYADAVRNGMETLEEDTFTYVLNNTDATDSLDAGANHLLAAESAAIELLNGNIGTSNQQITMAGVRYRALKALGELGKLGCQGPTYKRRPRFSEWLGITQPKLVCGMKMTPRQFGKRMSEIWELSEVETPRL